MKRPVIHPHNIVHDLSKPENPDLGGARTKEDIDRFEKAVDAAVKSGPIKVKRPNRQPGKP